MGSASTASCRQCNVGRAEVGEGKESRSEVGWWSGRGQPTSHDEDGPLLERLCMLRCAASVVAKVGLAAVGGGGDVFCGGIASSVGTDEVGERFSTAPLTGANKG